MKNVKILLFGSIGSGKSSLAESLKDKFQIIDLDQINRDLIKQNEIGFLTLKKSISQKYFQQNNQLDKKKLKKDIISNIKLRQTIEEILHPLIFESLLEKINKKEDIVITSPKIQKIIDIVPFDCKIKIECNIHEQIKRVQLRDGLDECLIKKLIFMQEKEYKCINSFYKVDSMETLDKQRKIFYSHYATI